MYPNLKEDARTSSRHQGCFPTAEIAAHHAWYYQIIRYLAFQYIRKPRGTAMRTDEQQELLLQHELEIAEGILESKSSTARSLRQVSPSGLKTYRLDI
jgi:DNA-directed RNA polymerase specialized sigma24 family protein